MSGPFRRRSGWLVVVVVVQAVLAAWVLNAVDLVDGSDRREFEPVPLTPSAVPMDIEDGYDRAFQQAQAWAPGARLVAVVMRLEWPVEGGSEEEVALPDGGWLIYTFAAGGETLSIFLDRRTGVYITSAASEFGDEILPAIDLGAYTRSSATAVLTAEILHGAAYRAECPESQMVTLVTASKIHDASGGVVPIWTVSYADANHPGEYDVLIQLDAQSGNVLESRFNDRPCDS